MTYTIELLDKAKKELQAIWEWYEEEKLGLGDLFEIEFYRKANLLQESPLHYPIKGKYRGSSYREANLKKFPVMIVYEILENQTIIVHSVFHTSRHPKRKLK